MKKDILKSLLYRINPLLNRWGFNGNSVNGLGFFFRFRSLYILGSNNTIICKGKLGYNVKIRIYGSNCIIKIEEGVDMQQGKIWIENDVCAATIGRNTTIENADLSLAENGCKLFIGEDCMLSFGIRIATTDSHSIIDLSTGQRLNPAADVIIKDHVWIGNHVSINKGVVVGENSVIAGNSVVTKDVTPNTIYAGVPAKCVKDNITWDRRRL